MQPASTTSTHPITITPLGAGQQVGRSCLVVTIKDRTIIFDTGIHMQYTDMQKYPDFRHICGQGGDINKYVDVVIITHFHLDHCGGLPYLTEGFGYTGPIYATMPTKAMIPYMLEDFRKVSDGIRKDKDKDKDMFVYTASQGRAAAQKITSIALQQTITYKGIKITPYYAGHVLGAGMFFIEYQGLSVLYTGDYNSYADRHLGAAYAPRLNPNIIITETTYATTIRDTKRDRERKMLKIVSETVENGGKVLIPVFALGRAQELSVLLETYWNRTENQVPVYFSAGLIEKANFYYKLFVQWQNQKIKEDFLTNNLFNFKKVKPFDKSLIRADFPYVLFATPGMLHGGTSLQIFKEWCGNPKNTIIIPGYCVPGTFGNRLLSGARKLEIDYREYEVNMKVENISFSAHADAKGIINLIRHVNAENIVFVHGDAQKMKIFEQVVRQQLGKPVFRPANKETISINCSIRKYLPIRDIGSIPREPAMSGYLLNTHKSTTTLNEGVKKQNYYKLVDERNILKQLNMMKDLLKCPESIIVGEEICTKFRMDGQNREAIMGRLEEREFLEQFGVTMEEMQKQREQEGEFQMGLDPAGKKEDMKMYDEQEVAADNNRNENIKVQPKQPNPHIIVKGDLKNIINLLKTHNNTPI